MEEKEVINVLQHYRHDLMNNLQVVQGYLTMGRSEKVKSKIESMLQDYKEESRLMGLKAPCFTLWVLRFDHLHSNLRMKYRIKTESKDLSTADKVVTELCKKTVDWLREACEETRMYDIILEVTETETPSRIQVSILLTGEVQHTRMEEQILPDERIHVRQTADGMKCDLFVPLTI
ncbi:Spo0B domain-containing protein [Virgibacillus xinjiangensis]|uniref:Spo0B domain-containing protein n=1 Tax=Virgibacillus xinjiangensis TaxID=393090 RepID=A0ABV7CSA4_9BACI